MAERKISELPVVDAQGRPVGLIDITDVVGLLPRETAPPTAGGKPAAANRAMIPSPANPACRLFPASDEESEP